MDFKLTVINILILFCRSTVANCGKQMTYYGKTLYSMNFNKCPSQEFHLSIYIDCVTKFHYGYTNYPFTTLKICEIYLENKCISVFFFFFIFIVGRSLKCPGNNCVIFGITLAWFNNSADSLYDESTLIIWSERARWNKTVFSSFIL
jgi:hypothetical protein